MLLTRMSIEVDTRWMRRMGMQGTWCRRKADTLANGSLNTAATRLAGQQPSAGVLYAQQSIMPFAPIKRIGTWAVSFEELRLFTVSRGLGLSLVTGQALGPDLCTVRDLMRSA